MFNIYIVISNGEPIMVYRVRSDADTFMRENSGKGYSLNITPSDRVLGGTYGIPIEEWDKLNG